MVQNRCWERPQPRHWQPPTYKGSASARTCPSARTPVSERPVPALEDPRILLPGSSTPPANITG
jgi:hypothetical protein